MSLFELPNELTPTRPLSVAELTGQIKDLVEAGFPAVWVAGEISNFARPQSGHCYLTLKDDEAQLRAVVWRNVAAHLRFELHDGLEVICRGRVEVYAPRGTYQLIIEAIEPRGLGALELALRQLREKLAREGLFDPARKRPLPEFVRQIAVVTSPTGAAIRDFLQVLRRRWRGADVLILPARVQGEGSAQEIAAAVAVANRLARPIDVLVVTRGGGSLEDLWSFNEEVVVRAIAASRIPVISAVGHEIDVTLSDLAADVRALTPSEAAELVAPASEEFLNLLHQLRKRLTAALKTQVQAARARLDAVVRQAIFRRPFQQVFERARLLDEIGTRLHRAMKNRAQHARQRAEATAARLESLSPLAVLGRGYSLTQQADGRVVRSAAGLAPGQRIITRFAAGRAMSRVEETEG
jgi:exodeoxyribonuclease VII large subunit